MIRFIALAVLLLASATSYAAITSTTADVTFTDCGHQTSGVRTWRLTLNGSPVSGLADFTSITPYQLTGLTPGAFYAVSVSCVDVPYPGSPELLEPSITPFVFRTLEAAQVYPSAPSALTVTAVTSSVVSLSWTAASGTPTGYRVYANKEMVGTTSSTAFNHTGLTALSGRNYYVVAYNADDNESDKTNTVQGVTCE